MSTSQQVPTVQEHYEAVTFASGRSHSAARQHLPAGVSRQTLAHPPYPLFADRGQAQFLWDVDGNRYLDPVNNCTSLIHRHAHPPSVSAAVHQLQRGTGCLSAPTTDADCDRFLIELQNVLTTATEQTRLPL